MLHCSSALPSSAPPAPRGSLDTMCPAERGAVPPGQALTGGAALCRHPWHCWEEKGCEERAFSPLWRVSREGECTQAAASRSSSSPQPPAPEAQPGASACGGAWLEPGPGSAQCDTERGSVFDPGKHGQLPNPALQGGQRDQHKPGEG